MPRAIGSKPAQKGDGRKRWHRSRAPPQNRDDSLSTQPAVVSQTTFDERIRAIPSMDLEALPSVIDEARLVENVAAVVEACLQQILGHTAPGSLRKPHPEQVHALRRLIFVSFLVKAIRCLRKYPIRMYSLNRIRYQASCDFQPYHRPSRKWRANRICYRV